MRLNVRFIEENERFNGMRESDESFRMGFGEITTVTENDYNRLANKPIINSVVIEGSLTAEDLGLGKVYYDNCANWDMQRSIIAEKAAIYVYSDYQYIIDAYGNAVPVAGLKIGDGTSYLVDMPFVTDALTSMILTHISNRDIHVTMNEREFWNNKVSTYFNAGEPENLVFSKTHYVID